MVFGGGGGCAEFWADFRAPPLMGAVSMLAGSFSWCFLCLFASSFADMGVECVGDAGSGSHISLSKSISHRREHGLQRHRGESRSSFDINLHVCPFAELQCEIAQDELGVNGTAPTQRLELVGLNLKRVGSHHRLSQIRLPLACASGCETRSWSNSGASRGTKGQPLAPCIPI